MDKLPLISTPTQGLAIFLLGMASSEVMALPAFPTEVDTGCTAFNGSTPVANYASYGVSRCNICHNANNRSISILPEWDWTKGTPGTPASESRENFCFVQGIIETPTGNQAFAQGSTINVKARGFSPRGKASPLTYTFSFSDGRPDLVISPSSDNWSTYPQDNVVSVDQIPLPSTGNLTITLRASDSTGASDPTEDARTITVSDLPLLANTDHYTVQSGNTLSILAKNGVLANDSGIGTLTATLQVNVTHGALILSPNGAFSYTPNAGFVGTDNFSYQASNGSAQANATVVIEVTPAPPVANDDRFVVQPNKTLSVAAPGVLSNDTGAPPLKARLAVNAHFGTMTLSPDGSFQYRPKGGRFTGTDSFTYYTENGFGVRSGNVGTVVLDVGACTDQDGDGYSLEGGNCGPIDCNDRNREVNPQAPEICTNNVDDDCNGYVDATDPSCTGEDCVGKLKANQVTIGSAVWRSNKLTVRGSRATPGAMVTVSKVDPANVLDAPIVLGTTTVAANGTWRFTQNIAGSANAPCRVMAEINGASGIRAVTGSTADCSSHNGATECGL